MATLIELKKEIETKHQTKIQLTFSGAAEAHLLAKEIAGAGVGVILIPSRPLPTTWKSRRMYAAFTGFLVDLLSSFTVYLGLL